MSLWDIENEYYEQGYGLICGCDEAGAGPLAGPVCAAAVILPRGVELKGLNDSKKLTEKTRERLFEPICETALAWATAFVDEREIDEINILRARLKAMELAILKLDPKPDLALIDGNRNTGITTKNVLIVKGDSLSASIAAASVLAKVSRDRYMCELAKKYPEYGFERHKGYGTRAHYAALREYGPCEAHRVSFLRKLH